MARFARMDEVRGRAGRRHGGGDLAADMTGFSHAGNDHAAAGVPDQVDRGNERMAKPVADRGNQCGDAAGFRFQRPDRAGDQVAFMRALRAAQRFRFGHDQRRTR